MFFKNLGVLYEDDSTRRDGMDCIIYSVRIVTRTIAVEGIRRTFGSPENPSSGFHEESHRRNK